MGAPHPPPAGHPTDRPVGTAPAIAALRAQIRHLASFDAVGSPHVPTVLAPARDWWRACSMIVDREPLARSLR